VGWTDSQVKIRGYRNEIGEIENTLVRHEAVEEVVVVAAEMTGGDKKFVRDLNQRQRSSRGTHRDLGGKLPDYMIPSFFIQIDQFPINRNGKIDR
jgi:fengycin family lipopeptide synthetase D